MHPQTLKGLFYILESAYVVEESEGEYRTVARLSGSKRLSYEVPFQWIANNTRITLQHDSYGSIVDFLEHAQKQYRRDLLATSDVYIKIWTVKDDIYGMSRIRRLIDNLKPKVIVSLGRTH